jgi:hypothetical protein
MICRQDRHSTAQRFFSRCSHIGSTFVYKNHKTCEAQSLRHMKHRAKNKLRLLIQAQPLTHSGLHQKAECKPIALRSQNSFNIAAESAIREKTRKPTRLPRFRRLVRQCYGVGLGSAAGASSEDSDLDLPLSLFFEVPLSLVPSSLVVLRCLPVARSVVVSSELLVPGAAVALLSP